MNRIMLWAVVWVLTACQPRHAPLIDESKVLKTYEVPAGTARDLAHIIARIGYEKDTTPQATAEVLPDGKLAVYASREFQAGVEPLLKSVTSQGSIVTIDFQVWQVLGKRADKTVIGPGLDGVRAELEETTKVYGPMEFSLLTPTRLQVAAGERGDVSNALGSLKVEATVSSQRIFTRLEVDTTLEPGKPSLSFRTLVQLSPSKTVVIGQNTARERKDGEAQTLFYLVNGALVP